MKNYFWDKRGVRYQLTNTNADKPYNWLFFPGGPGVDSRYFLSLFSHVNLPGNVWLIDFPANGDNTFEGSLVYNFDNWFHHLLPVISQFKNPVYVGHSFGGMFPLLFPQLEEILTGFVILNSSPSLWLEEAANVATQKGLPLLIEPLEAFGKNPSDETFAQAIDACMPYYFPAETLARGHELLKEVPMNYRAALWWLNKAIELNFTATWVPNKINTLIIGGTEDCICPASLFEKDLRFVRDNILWKKIAGAGHMPWVENPIAVKTAFLELIARLN